MCLKTGDILLFNEHPDNWLMATIDSTIRCFTRSQYSHAGLVVINPPWAPEGKYIWDSSKHNIPDPSDNKIKFGIALVPLEHYLDKTTGRQQLYVRRPLQSDTYKLFSDVFLSKLHDKVYGKHYDLTFSHWLAGFLHILIPRSTETFFCSAFVSFALVSAGILSKKTDWTIISPAQLSSENDDHLHWLLNYGPDTPYPINNQ